jgi:hypothetical protein
MNIEPNDNGWTFDGSVGWKLVHDGCVIIFYGYTDKSISTQNILFMGAEEECQAEIIRLNLIQASESEINLLDP